MEREPRFIETESIDCKEIAQQLESLQAKKNEGRGVSCVRTIISYLKNNDLDNAKAVCYNESDKLSSYPDIMDFIKENLFEKDEENPWSMMDRF